MTYDKKRSPYIPEKTNHLIDTVEENISVDSEINDLLRQKEYQVAEKKINDLLKETPNDTSLLYNLSNIYIAQGDIKRAQETINRVIEDGVITYKILTCSALIEKALGNKDKSLSLFRQAADMDRENPIPFVVLCSELLELNMYPEALETAERLIKISPEKYFGYHAKLSGFVKSQRFEEAEAFLESIEGQFLSEQDYIYDRAIVYCVRQEYKQAWQFLALQEENTNSELDVFYELKAEIASKMKDKDLAKEAFKSLYEKTGSMKSALKMAMLLMTDENFFEAKTYLEQMISQSVHGKEYFTAVYLRPICMMMLEEDGDSIRAAFQEAVKIYEDAYEKSIFNAYVLEYEAECFRRLGDTEKELQCKRRLAEARQKFEI